jgi:hypothetical protein
MFWDDKPELRLNEILVLPDRRRAAIGSALIHLLAEHAIAERFAHIWTWPSPVGGQARRADRIAFFRNCAFVERVVGEQIEMIGDPETVLAATA